MCEKPTVVGRNSGHVFYVLNKANGHQQLYAC